MLLRSRTIPRRRGVDRSPVSRKLGLAILASALFWAQAGCATSRQDATRRLGVPALEARVEHRAGSPLGGIESQGQAARLNASPEEALEVSFELHFLERAPSGCYESLRSHSRLVAVERGGEVIETASALAAGGRVARGESALQFDADAAKGLFGRTRSLGLARGVLPRGVTSTLLLDSAETLESPEHGAARKELRVELGRGEDPTTPELTLALTLEDLLSAPAKETDDPQAGAPRGTPGTTATGERVLRRESVLLDLSPSVEDGPVALVLPAPFQGGEARALAVVVRVAAAGGDPDHAVRVAGALAQCGAAEAEATRRRASVGAPEARTHELEAAVLALGREADRRAALLFLAGMGGARLCGDVALCADGPTLEALASRVRAESTLLLPSRDAAELGWPLESATARTLVALGAEAPLAPELVAALVRNTGEIGRSLAALEDLVRTSPGLAEYHARIEADNLIFLEDHNPAVRVRAFDWLAARGRAPAQYDPLAPVKERRAALAALEGAGGER